VDLDVQPYASVPLAARALDPRTSPRPRDGSACPFF